MSQQGRAGANDDFMPNIRKEKIKDEILDENFQNAKSLRKPQVKKTNSIQKKPFLKSGILIMIIALFCLIIIQFAPWMYITFDVENGKVEEFYYKDFKNDNIEDADTVNSSADDIYSIFESSCTNCSNNSNNFIGLDIYDFSYTPKMTTYGFIILFAMGLIFTIFTIVDKVKKISMDTTAIVHSLFATGIILIGAFVLFLNIKFIGTYFLLHHNWSFIDIKNLKMIFIAPFILIAIMPLIIKGATAIIKMNFNELKNKSDKDTPEKPFLGYKFGGRS